MGSRWGWRLRWLFYVGSLRSLHDVQVIIRGDVDHGSDALCRHPARSFVKANISSLLRA